MNSSNQQACSVTFLQNATLDPKTESGSEADADQEPDLIPETASGNTPYRSYKWGREKGRGRGEGVVVPGMSAF